MHGSESIEIEWLMVLALNHYEEVEGLMLCNELVFKKESEVLKDTFNVSWSNVNPMYLTET